MRSTNLFIVRGYVGQTPKQFGTTTKVSIATNHVWTDSKGQRHEETDWVTVTILNEKTAQWVAENVQKGDPVYAECRIAETSYKKDGATVYTTDIIANLFDSLVPSAKDDSESSCKVGGARSPAFPSFFCGERMPTGLTGRPAREKSPPLTDPFSRTLPTPRAAGPGSDWMHIGALAPGPQRAVS